MERTRGAPCVVTGNLETYTAPPSSTLDPRSLGQNTTGLEMVTWPLALKETTRRP